MNKKKLKKKPLQPKLLGQKVDLPEHPETAFIECVANPYPNHRYVARFVCPEFTSLCPVTGQPDYARFLIDYVPNKRLIESKALKLFLGSFRNHGDFHEACTVMIASRLCAACQPYYMRVTGVWFPRGGISIDVFWEWGKVPKGVTLPPINTDYRSR